MHAPESEVLSRFSLSLFSAVGDGMHVEVSALAEEAANQGPLMSFREDEELGHQVVLHLGNRDVAFPLSELQLAIAFAQAEVHKESFYG